ncbi:MAG: FtsX-like permease family protein [Candidatus Ornithospirochaeta sp.]|nr:FtsX-like permease family protein [Candidatus Ornithospirochaeta sp.]
MIKAAFLNCLRNRRRTALTGLSIALAVLVVVLLMSFTYSCFDSMLDNERRFSIGDIRIRTEKYSEFESLMPLQFYIENLSAIKERLLDTPGIKGAESVIRVYASLYRDSSLTNISVVGADPGSAYMGEGTIIHSGRLAQDETKEAMATPKLLSACGLEVGDSVTVIFRTASGGTNAATFQIVGSVGYMNAEMNGSMLVTSASALSGILRIQDGTIEIHAWTEDGIDSKRMAEELRDRFSGEGLEIKAWQDVSVMYPMMPLYDTMVMIIVLLFFFIASTLVFNTMMMSTLERKKEISTMIAIGFSRGYVIAQLVAEGLIIALLFSVSGALIGKIIITVLGITGMDLTGMGVESVDGFGFPNILYLELRSSRYLMAIAVEMAVTAAAGILATWRVRKLEVAEALREEE